MDYSTDKIELIKESVDIHDLFDLSSPPVDYDSRDIPCQVGCPFHGHDIHKSARVFPRRGDGEGNSLYCWACSKSWDVIDYWAEINQWWKTDELTGKESLDAGRAISDLLYRFDLRHKRPDWRKKLDKSLKSIAKRKDGFSEVPVEEREELRLYYSSRLVKVIEGMDKDSRAEKWDTVRTLWDGIDNVDISSPDWWDDLAGWNRSLKSLNSG